MNRKRPIPSGSNDKTRLFCLAQLLIPAQCTIRCVCLLIGSKLNFEALLEGHPCMCLPQLDHDIFNAFFNFIKSNTADDWNDETRALVSVVWVVLVG